MTSSPLALSINSGSSSLKIAYFHLEDAGQERCVLSAAAELHPQGCHVTVRNEAGGILTEELVPSTAPTECLEKLYRESQKILGETPAIIGHRIVHGGPELLQHQAITEQVLKTLTSAIHYAPSHLPTSIDLIRQMQQHAPAVRNVACFDTTFHQTMPAAAKRLPIPLQLHRAGVQRYGFHGLSYESVVERLADGLPERLIVAHLGNGASVCAVHHGRSVDTTMSFTPTGGIPMSTRSGDLDPGILLYLMRTQSLDVDRLEALLTHEAGLFGVSGQSGDMEDLLRRRDRNDPDADLALQVFTRAVRKQVGAYAALLGGVDLLVFTGGIGEHSDVVRTMVCDGLEFLGVSQRGTSSTVRVMAAEEERQIARICRSVLSPSQATLSSF